MNYIKMMFNKASKLALPRTDNDLKKNFWLGCIGIRSDNVEVYGRNIGTSMGDINWDNKGFDKIKSYQKIINAHAEGRVMRKLDHGGILFVVRIGKEPDINGKFDFKMACPCNVCSFCIKSKKVSRVYYTINNFQYGIRNINTDCDLVKDF